MKDKIQELNINKLTVSPFNSRKSSFELMDLMNSIESVGLLQPIVARPIKNKFEVVAGQRRFEACKKLKWKKIPSVIKKLSDLEAMEVSLIENIQQDTLDPIDRAECENKLVKVYMTNFTTSREQAVRRLSTKLGRSRTMIVDDLALLPLANSIKTKVRKGKISVVHASRLEEIKDDERIKETAEVIEELDNGYRHLAPRIINHVKAYPEEPVEELAEEILDQEEYTVPTPMSGKLYRALSKATDERNSTFAEIMREALERWLKEEGYL